ncbi:MAG: bis(5'-nucleosyl)-tetraphosphatase (symmetrical) YqeK [Candidatus Hydrogenedentota bacterium]
MSNREQTGAQLMENPEFHEVMPQLLEAHRAEAFLAALRQRLPEKKVRHCISVTGHLLACSEDMGLDFDASVAAGLLHDYARALDNAEMLRRANACGIAVNGGQRARPKLLHGPVGAAEIARDFGIEDEAVLEAVHWHTTGIPGVGRLAQALYVADFSEPMRPYPEAEEARTILACAGFDAALCYVAETKLRFHEQKGAADPHSMAFAAWVIAEFG